MVMKQPHHNGGTMAQEQPRNYAADMRAYIDERTSRGPYVSREIANEIVAALEVDDPDLLEGWLYAQAELMIWSAINQRDRSIRSKTRHSASASVFEKASQAHAEGDSVPLRRFLDLPFVVADGTRCKLAELVATDLRYVASGYDQRAKESAMNAAFFRALAQKVGRKKVGDVFSEEKIAAMWNSLNPS